MHEPFHYQSGSRQMPLDFVMIGGIEDSGTQNFFSAAWWVGGGICALSSEVILQSPTRLHGQRNV
jgi:hypothetical protein